MATIEYYWTKTAEPIRISEFATSLGFNLRTLEYESVPDDKWEWINKKIRNVILAYVSECWEDNKEERNSALSSVNQGIYVVTLSDNLSIDYRGKPSKVLYIGRGQIHTRLSDHFKHWIRYFTDSLQDISFDIWMTEVKVSGSRNAYKEVETDLLNHFYYKFECYPIQNAKNGDYHEKAHDYCEAWNEPLRNPTNINNGWSIKPLRNNDWAFEFEEDA
ncbi:MAG: hypothetical protein IEMM0007_1300 [bacterium]|nr:MAG: hypothetical protein IEMM0007_1300 [bacterium]